MHWTNVRIAFIVFVCATQIAGDNHNETYTDPSINTSNDGIWNSLASKNRKAAMPLTSAPTKPVPTASITPTIAVPDDNFTDLVRLGDVLTVFDLTQLANKWPQVKDTLQLGCAAQMTNYFRGLQQRKLWAIKSKLWSCWPLEIIRGLMVFGTRCKLRASFFPRMAPAKADRKASLFLELLCVLKSECLRIEPIFGVQKS